MNVDYEQLARQHVVRGFWVDAADEYTSRYLHIEGSDVCYEVLSENCFPPIQLRSRGGELFYGIKGTWNNDRNFIAEDGTPSMAIKVRTRLATLVDTSASYPTAPSSQFHLIAETTYCVWSESRGESLG